MKREEKFNECVIGLGDVLVYELKRYNTQSVMKSLRKLCSLTDREGIRESEIESIKCVLRRIKRTAYDFDDTTVEEFIENELDKLEDM